MEQSLWLGGGAEVGGGVTSFFEAWVLDPVSSVQSGQGTVLQASAMGT